jgi:hypothetical protein
VPFFKPVIETGLAVVVEVFTKPVASETEIV